MSEDREVLIVHPIPELTRQVVRYGLVEQFNRGLLAALAVCRSARSLGEAEHRIRALLLDPNEAFRVTTEPLPGADARGGQPVPPARAGDASTQKELP